MIKPSDMAFAPIELSEVIKLFDREIVKQPKGLQKYTVIIGISLPLIIRLRVMDEYKSAGWINVTCDHTPFGGGTVLNLNI